MGYGFFIKEADEDDDAYWEAEWTSGHIDSEVDCIYEITGLRPGTEYKYYFYAVSENKSFGDNGDLYGFPPETFKTKEEESHKELDAPELECESWIDAYVGDDVEIDWAPVDGADRYALIVYDENGNALHTDDYGYPDADIIEDRTRTTYSFDEGAYSVQVYAQADIVNGMAGVQSEPATVIVIVEEDSEPEDETFKEDEQEDTIREEETFEEDEPEEAVKDLDAPRLTSDSSVRVRVGETVDVDWDPVDGADRYALIVYDENGNALHTDDYGYPAADIIEDRTRIGYSFKKGAYSIQVYAQAGIVNGIASVQSEPATVIAIVEDEMESENEVFEEDQQEEGDEELDTPELECDSLIYAQKGEPVTINWKAVEGADRYALIVYDENGNALHEDEYGKPIADIVENATRIGIRLDCGSYSIQVYAQAGFVNGRTGIQSMPATVLVNVEHDYEVHMDKPVKNSGKFAMPTDQGHTKVSVDYEQYCKDCGVRGPDYDDYPISEFGTHWYDNDEYLFDENEHWLEDVSCNGQCGYNRSNQRKAHSLTSEGKCSICGFVKSMSVKPSPTTTPYVKPSVTNSEEDNSIIGELLAVLLGASESQGAVFQDPQDRYSMYYRFNSDDTSIYQIAPATLTFTSDEVVGKTITLWGVSSKAWVQPNEHWQYETHINDPQKILKGLGKHSIKGTFTGQTGTATVAIYDTKAKKYICSVIIDIVAPNLESEEYFAIEISYTDDNGNEVNTVLPSGGDVNIVSYREVIPVTLRIYSPKRIGESRELDGSRHGDATYYVGRQSYVEKGDIFVNYSGDINWPGVGKTCELKMGKNDASDATIKFYVKGDKKSNDYVVATVHFTVDRKSAYPDRFSLWASNVPRNGTDSQITIFPDPSSTTVKVQLYAYDEIEQKLAQSGTYGDFEFFRNGTRYTGTLTLEAGTYDFELRYRRVLVDKFTLNVEGNRLDKLGESSKDRGEYDLEKKVQFFNIKQSCVWVNDDYDYIVSYEDAPWYWHPRTGSNPYIGEEYLSDQIAPSHILLLTPKDAQTFANFLSGEGDGVFAREMEKYLKGHIGKLIEMGGGKIGDEEAAKFFGDATDAALTAISPDGGPSKVVYNMVTERLLSKIPGGNIAKEIVDIMTIIAKVEEASVCIELAEEINKHIKDGSGISIVWGYDSYGYTNCYVRTGLPPRAHMDEWKDTFYSPTNRKDVTLTGYIVTDQNFINDVFAESMEYWNMK